MSRLSELRRTVHHRWPVTLAKSKVDYPGKLPKVPKLIGSSTKTEKGAAKGWTTGVVYMSPGKEAFTDGRTLCPWAGACEAICLGVNSGRMIMAPLKLSRLWKTALYMGDRWLWRDLLEAEVEALWARSAGPVAIRVDGTSDTGEGDRLATRLAFPDFEGLQFYDYTKSGERAIGNLLDRQADRTTYHVTYSVSEKDMHPVGLSRLDGYLAMGGNAAVVFGGPLPSTWRGHTVIDADAHDLRFLDEPGTIAGLSFKAARAPAKSLVAGIEGGFVVEVV